MARLFDCAARPAERIVTVGSLRAGKGHPARHAQVTADTEEEAAAAEAAGIEMVVCRAVGPHGSLSPRPSVLQRPSPMTTFCAPPFVR